jgi:hypothetical protein
MENLILSSDTTEGWYLDFNKSIFDNFDTGYESGFLPLWYEPTVGGKKISSVIDDHGLAGPLCQES